MDQAHRMTRRAFVFRTSSQVPDNDYGEFQVALEEEITKAGLQNIPGFHKKVIQMFDIFNIRFGATLVGPTGAGKSTCYRILAKVMTTLHKNGSKNDQYQEVRFEILNPKRGDRVGFDFAPRPRPRWCRDSRPLGTHVLRWCRDSAPRNIPRAAVVPRLAPSEYPRPRPRRRRDSPPRNIPRAAVVPRLAPLGISASPAAAVPRLAPSDLSARRCITMGELYGEVNMVTQEWRDGLASTIMRRAVNEETPVRKWTVFDGPIDALWIENMNTVLDDNMTLCLANGERIKLKIEMKMLFEVMDLAVASPATVSRIGVVFMTPSDLGWMPYITSWTQTLPEVVPDACREKLLELFDKYFQRGLTFQRKKCQEPVGCVDIQLATSASMIFQSIFVGPEGKVDFEGYQKTPELLLRLVEKLWFFSFIWSVGGSCRAADHEAFDYFAKDMLDQGGVALDVPGPGLAFDYFVQVENQPGGKFLPWKQIVPKFKFDRDVPYRPASRPPSSFVTAATEYPRRGRRDLHGTKKLRPRRRRELHGISTLRPRCRRDLHGIVHVAAAAPPRAPRNCPRCGRGAAATRLRAPR